MPTLGGAGMGGAAGAGIAGLTGNDVGQGAMIGAGIGAGMGAMTRGIGGRLAGSDSTTNFFMRKEALAAQIEPQSPQVAQLIRQARDEMDLEDIIGRLQR